jgi:hypothetical protein
MASLNEQIDAELKMRELLEDSGLPQPDRVEYGRTCIRMFWHDTKSVVVVDIDEPDEECGHRPTHSAAQDGDADRSELT